MQTLVVEDNDQIRHVIVDLLTRRGHDVASYADAESAWSATQDTIFDISVLDWYLPGLTGVELCHRFRARPGGGAGVILILTGRGEHDDLDHVVAAGADDYLTKPFKLDWLETRIAFAERRVADLAEKVSLHVALQQSEAKFRSLVQHSFEMIGVIDADGRRTYVSPSTEQMVGVPTGSLIGTPVHESFGLDDEAKLAAADLFQRVLNQPGSTATGEFTSHFNTRGSRRLEVRATNLLDDPHVQGIVLNARDITEQRQVAEQLRGAETRYRMLVEQIPAIVYIQRFDGDHATTYMSPRVECVIGHSPEEFLADAGLWDATLHPHEREQIIAAKRLVTRTGQPWRMEYRLRHRDGHYVWVRDEAELVPVAEGCLHWQGILVDITEERVAANRLRESEQLQRTLLFAAERRATELRLLHEVRSALARQYDLSSVIRSVVDAVARTFGYTFVSAYLREGDELVLHHHVGYATPIERFPITQGVAGRVLRTGKAVLLEDGRVDPAFLSAESGMCSEVCVPISGDGDPIGVLILETLESTCLGDADLQLMTALAEHVDTAIERVRLFSAARDSETRYRTVVEHVQEVIFQTDVDGNWTFLNSAWTEITGHAVEASLGRPAASFVQAGDHNRFLWELNRLAPSDERRKRFEVGFVTADQDIRWLEIHARTRKHPISGQIDISGTLTDVTERRRAEDALRESQARYRHLAMHDALTGLPNRALFLDRLTDAVASSSSHGHGVAVLFIDLDGFKSVNDQWGHDSGDLLLERVAERLLSSLNPSDLVARLGGDEFAVLLEENVDRVRAESVAHYLQQSLHAPFEIDERETVIGMSIGIALGHGDSTSPGDLLRAADIALYEAKGAGRATTVIFNPAMSSAKGHHSKELHDHRSRPGRSFHEMIERRSSRVKRSPADRRTSLGQGGPLDHRSQLPAIPDADGVVVLRD